MSSSWSWWRWCWQSRFLLCFVWSQHSTAVSRSAALNFKLLSHLTWWSEQTGSKRFVFVITWGRSCINLWGIPITRDLIITGICHYCLSFHLLLLKLPSLLTHSRFNPPRYCRHIFIIFERLRAHYALMSLWTVAPLIRRKMLSRTQWSAHITAAAAARGRADVILHL